MNGNKLATGQILKKPVEVVKGRILAGWAQKSPEPWAMGVLDIYGYEHHLCPVALIMRDCCFPHAPPDKYSRRHLASNVNGLKYT